MPLPSNTRFGRYEVSHLLGKGGMGEVYLAQDTILERPVAIKLLPSDLARDSQRLHRFKREAHATSNLNHPNILTIHEIGQAEGQHFIVSEYVEGESLRCRLAHSRLELTDTLCIAIQIAEALVAAHRAGVVHRDIKPENIMLRPDGYVKILDFGLAKLLDQEPANQAAGMDENAKTRTMNNTVPGMVMGTDKYMSPEQARGLMIDARTDIWSLGVMLYEMASGSRPFNGETQNDVIAAVLTSEPLSLASLSPHVPEKLEAIIKKALSKRREERYQDIKDLLNDLKDLKQELDIARKLGQPIVRQFGEAGTSAAKRAGQSYPPQSIKEAIALAYSGPGYIASGVKRNRTSVTSTLVACVITIAATAYFIRSMPSPDARVITSIAVLAFANESGDPELEYLSPVLSENLIDRLSQTPLTQLKVTARTSSFKFKSNDNLREVARALEAEALVVGEVTVRGDNLRISVELVDAHHGARLWGRQYDTKWADISKVEESVYREIFSKLNIGNSEEGSKTLSNRQTNDVTAEDLYRKGRYCINKGTESELKKAIDYFTQAIERDQNYALAHAGLASSYITAGANYDFVEDAYLKAFSSAQKAMDLDDTLPEVHYAMAMTKYINDRDLLGAEKELRRALDLKPNYAQAYYLLGKLHWSNGRADEAVADLEKAKNLDPFDLLVNYYLGLTYQYSRQHDRAIDQMLKTIEMEPTTQYLYSELGVIYAQAGMHEKALAACQKALHLKENDPGSLASLGIVNALSGRNDEAERMIGLLDKTKAKKHVLYYYMANIYAALNRTDEAILWLERADEQGYPLIISLKVDPIFNNVRSAPGYKTLLQRIYKQ